MKNIFQNLPNNLIMNIIKMETIRKHEEECEELVNDMIYNFDPNDYDDIYYNDVNQYGMTDEEFENHLDNQRFSTY